MKTLEKTDGVVNSTIGETREGGADRPHKICLRFLYVHRNGDLMEGRVNNLIRLYLGSSIDNSCECLQHFGICIGIVGFGIRFGVPQTDCRHIQSAGHGECDFVPEARLFAE